MRWFFSIFLIFRFEFFQDVVCIFFAVKTYEDLVSKGYEAQVITVTGVENRGVQADEKVASEIKLVLKKFSANGAVIVSDGEDEIGRASCRERV